MTFYGFVPLRRGILEHIHDGRLTTIEFAVISCLIMLADKETGRGEINAPLLRYYLPDLSSDAAQRALCSLHKKGYIYRHKPSSCKQAYSYWVNKYEATVGQHKSRRLCLDVVARSKDLRDILYVDSPVPGATVTATQGAAQPANSNNNRKDKQEKREVAAVAYRDSLGSVTAEVSQPKPGVAGEANRPEPTRTAQLVALEIAINPHRQSTLSELAAIVKSRVNMTQSMELTQRESPGIEALDGTPLQDISSALDWALEEPFWSQRIGGAGALKSFLRNLTTIQRQIAAKEKATSKTNQTKLKAASVAALPNKAFAYEGEVL
jgi:hypothetical protein